MRTNGFQTPRNGMQVTTWVLFPVLTIQFCLFLTPNLPPPISIPITILFLLSGVSGVYYGYITTKTDSIDTKLYQHLNNRPHPHVNSITKRKMKLALEKKERETEAAGVTNQNQSPSKLKTAVGGLISIVRKGNTQESIEVQQSDTESQNDEAQGLNGDGNEDENEEALLPTKYCWVCQTNVYDTSMHCKYCDKCVSTFDHHCMWLNNCIGDANYGYFYKTVWSVFLFNFFHVTAQVIYLALYFSGHTETKALTIAWFNAGMPEVIIGFNIGFLVLTGSAGLLVMQLLWFHYCLRRERITTYQYIIRDGQRKREKLQLMQKVKTKRKVEVQRASDGGKCVQACWLSLGAKYCTLCDPIIPMVKDEMAALEEESDNDDSSGSNLAEDEKKSETAEEMRPSSSGNGTTKTDATL